MALLPTMEPRAKHKRATPQQPASPPGPVESLKDGSPGQHSKRPTDLSTGTQQTCSKLPGPGSCKENKHLLLFGVKTVWGHQLPSKRERIAMLSPGDLRHGNAQPTRGLCSLFP